MAATFNLYQQVFSLSMMSNWDSNPSEVSKTVPDLEQDLTAKIDKAFASSQMQALIGTWARAWGPVIFQHVSPGVADNAMFVAQGKDGDGRPLYVVAIAGTNAYSAYDEMTEDRDVAALAPLPSNPGGVNLLSRGTSLGVTHLEAMASPALPAGGPPQSLVQFLNGLGSTGGTLIFTGHSLGGALSSALAVDLVKYGGLQTGNFSEIYVYPTAGPTPGTDKFVSLFRDTFPLLSTGSNTYQAWNGLIWNSKDIVPHAWAQSVIPLPGEPTLGQIPLLYAPHIPLSLCISGLVAGARVLPLGIAYRQLPNSGAMQGTFNDSLPSTGDPVCDFLLQAYYQHIGAYFEMLGVTQLGNVGFNPTINLPPGWCGAFKKKFCLRVSAGQGASASSPPLR
jgi:hypothetical protein